MVDVVLWVLEDVVDDPVPACRSCAEAHGLRVVWSEPTPGTRRSTTPATAAAASLPSPRSWPMTVWVRDRRRLMAVCNACRVEYALQAVFTSAPPAGWRVRRGPESLRDEPGT